MRKNRATRLPRLSSRLPVLALLLIPLPTLACNAVSDSQLGGYHRYGFQGLTGPAATEHAGTVRIDKAFVRSLINNPDGKHYTKNKHELFYLISIGDKDALHAGLLVLLQLLKHPEYVVECDRKVQLYNVPELAFVLGRSFELNTALCRFEGADWAMLVKYYDDHPGLWGNGHDSPSLKVGYREWCGG